MQSLLSMYLIIAKINSNEGEPKMPKFRKKPIIIEAIKYLGNGDVRGGEVPEWMWNAFENGTMQATNGIDPLVIKTLEGDATVSPGDYIIQGVQGELYPCKPEIFAATYDDISA